MERLAIRWTIEYSDAYVGRLEMQTRNHEETQWHRYRHLMYVVLRKKPQFSHKGKPIVYEGEFRFHLCSVEGLFTLRLTVCRQTYPILMLQNRHYCSHKLHFLEAFYVKDGMPAIFETDAFEMRMTYVASLGYKTLAMYFELEKSVDECFFEYDSVQNEEPDWNSDGECDLCL